jgi:alpha-1,3-rhamnosyl/mannosyltransferase
MKIGFGSTVLENCLVSEHMDGIGVYANNLYSEFAKQGLKQKAISFGRKYQIDKTKLAQVTHLPMPYDAQAALSILTKTSFLSSASLKDDIDIFFAPDHHIPKLRDILVVATIMDTIPLVHPEFVSQSLRKFKNSAFKKTAHWANHIITISEYSKKDIVKYFDIDEDKISVVPLGVNEAFFQRVSDSKKKEVLKKYRLKSSFFVSVGTLQPRKNISRLIEAFELLPKEIQSANNLVIIGKYGWGEEELLTKLKSKELNKNIHWLQTVSDDELYALLQSSVGMVYPSLYEGFGLPLLEGFASGIPVVASNSTSLPEVGGDAVLYIDPYNSHDISDKMLRLVSSTELSKGLVYKGKERVKYFTWEKSSLEHIKVFEKVLKK